MTRQVLSECCAVLGVIGWLIVSPLAAQEAASASASSSTSASAPRLALVSSAPEQTAPTVYGDSAAERRINAALDQILKTPLVYESESLLVIVEQLKDEYQIPIVIDEAALDEVAISSESEITSDLRGISLRSALNLLLRGPGLEDLAFDIDNEVLLITTEDRRNENLITRVYRIDDLVLTSPRGRNSPYYDYDSLIDMIVCCVAHDSWQENGTGDGEIQPVPPGMIVVSQPRYIHRQIAALLQQIRTTKRLIAGEGSIHAE